MKINQSFTVNHPVPAVWAMFQDIPEMAKCMPGAELIEFRGDGRYAGRVGIRLGPFNASFEGEAKVSADPASRSGHAEGKGVDKRGGSRSRLTLDYRLMEVEGATRVDIDAHIQLSGPVAQFGRTGIIDQTAEILIGQFAQNIEARLAAGSGVAARAGAGELQAPAGKLGQPFSAAGSNRVGMAGILRKLLAAFLRRIFGARGSVHR
jgi:carbon monoxide dehydrogenase subunit G